MVGYFNCDAVTHILPPRSLCPPLPPQHFPLSLGKQKQVCGAKSDPQLLELNKVLFKRISDVLV